MGEDVYAKGTRLVEAGAVTVTDETARGAYLEVRGDSGVHHVRLMSDNTFNCTCTWGSLKGVPHGALCSHVVAGILLMAERSGEAARGPLPSRA